MIRGSRLKVYLRTFCGIFGVVSILLGVCPILVGDYSYTNWLGGLVFAPLATVAGVVMVLGAVFNWRSVWDTPPKGNKHHKASRSF
jgi:hypothetical protein